MKPGGLCSPSDGSSSPSGDEISSVSVACKTLGGSSQFPDASTSEDSPACLTPDLIEDRHQGAKPNSSIANGYICNDVTNGLCGTLYDTSKDIDVPRHVLSPPCSEDGEDGASRSRTISVGGVASKGSDPSTLYQGRCKTPESLEGRSPAAPSNKAKSLPPQLSGKSIEESPAGTSEHSHFSVYNESVDQVSAGSNSSKVTSCSDPLPAPHNVKSPKYRRKCSLEEMVAKLHNRSEPNIQAGSIALQAFSPTRTNPAPKEEVASCFTKTEGDDEPSLMLHSEHRQLIPCDNPNTATRDAHLLRDSSTKEVLPLCNSEEPTKACDELCVYNINSSGELCERTSGSSGSSAEKEDLDPSQSMLSEGDIPCESNTSKKHLDVSSTLDGGSSLKAVVNSDLTDTRTSLNDRTSASFCVSNEKVFNISKDAQSDVLVDVSRTTSEKDTIEKDAKFELEQKSCCSPKSESSSINIMPKTTSVEAIERKDSDEIEVLTSRETSVENEVINLVDDDTGDSGSDVEILYEKRRHVGMETAASACPKGLRKGDTGKRESARKSSLSGSGYGNGQYLEPISDEENSLICAPSPPSELSSASGFPSSSDTPLFSDTPSDASRGAIMVKISDAVAAILSDVSDDSLPPSPEESSTQNSFSNLLPKLLAMNDKCSGSPVDSVVGERSLNNEDDEKISRDSETVKDEVSCGKVTFGDVCVAQSDEKKCESGDLMQMSLTVDSSCKERSIGSPKKVDVDLPSSLTNEIDSNLTELNQTKSIDMSLDLSASHEQKANVGLPSSSTSEALESADTNSRVSSVGSGHSGPSQLVKSLVDRLPCRSCSMHSTPLLSNDPCNTNSLCQKPTSGTPCLSSQPNNCNRLRSGCRECVPGLGGKNISQDSLTGCMSVDNLQLEIHHKDEPTTLRESDEPLVESVSDLANEIKKTETSETSHGNILTPSVPDRFEESVTSQTTVTQPLSTPKDEIKTASVLETDKVRAEAGTSATYCDVIGKIIVPSTSSEDSEDKGSAQPPQESVLVSSAPEAVLACKNLSSDLWDNNGKLGVHSKPTEEPQTTTVSVECTEGSMNPASTSLAVHKDVDLSSNVAFYEGRSNFLSSSVDEGSSLLGKSTAVEEELPLETQDSSIVDSLPEISDDNFTIPIRLSSDSKLESDHLLSSDLTTGHVSDIESLSQLTNLDHKNQTSIGIVSCNDSVSTGSQSLISEVESMMQIACSEGNTALATKSGSNLELVFSHDKNYKVPPFITETAIPNTSLHSAVSEEEKCTSSNTVIENHSVEALLLIPEDLENDSCQKSSVPDDNHTENKIEDLVLPSTLKTSSSQEPQLCQPLNEDPSDEVIPVSKAHENQSPVISATPQDSSTRVLTEVFAEKTEPANVTNLLANLEDELPSGDQSLIFKPEEEKSESLLTVESRLDENDLEKVCKELDEGVKVVDNNTMKEAVHSFVREVPINVAYTSPKNSVQDESISGIQVRKVPLNFTPIVMLEEEKAECLDNCSFNSKTSPKAGIASPKNDGMCNDQQSSESVPEASCETESTKIFSDCAKTDTIAGVLERLVDPLENRFPIRTSDLQVTESVALAVPVKPDETQVFEDSVITDSGLVPDIDVKGLGGVKIPEEVVAEKIMALVDSTDVPAIRCPDAAAKVNIACELHEIPKETEMADKGNETESDSTTSPVLAGSCQADVLCPVIPETENNFMIDTRLQLEPGCSTASLTEAVPEKEDVTKSSLGIKVSDKSNLTFSESDSDVFSNKVALDPNATKLPMEVKVSESSITTLTSRVSDPILSERVKESAPSTITDSMATPLPETMHEPDETEILGTDFIGENPNERVVSEDTLENETLTKGAAVEGKLDTVNREINDIKGSAKLSEESSKIEEQQETDVTQPSAVPDFPCKNSLDESSHEHLKTETSCNTLISPLELDNTKISSETSDQFLPVKTSDDFGITDTDCVGKDVQSENSVTESNVETVLTEVHCKTLEEAVRSKVLYETAFETTSTPSETQKVEISEKTRDNVDKTEVNSFIAKQPGDDVTKKSMVSLHAGVSFYSSLSRTSAESDIVNKLDEYVSMVVEAVLPDNAKETDSAPLPTDSVKASTSVEPATVEEQFEKGPGVTGELFESGIIAEKVVNEGRDASVERTLVGENDVTKVTLDSSPTETSVVTSADKSIDSHQSKSLFETKMAKEVDPILMESTVSKASDLNVPEPADVELDKVCGKSLDKISLEPNAVISETADSLPLHDNSSTLVDLTVNEASVRIETDDCELTPLSSQSKTLLKAPGISATETPVSEEFKLDEKLCDVINKTPESSESETPCEMHETPKLTVDPQVPVSAVEPEESQESALTSIKAFEIDKIRQSAKSREPLETEHIQESTFGNSFRVDEKQELVTPENTIEPDHFLEFNEILESTTKIQESFVTDVQETSKDSESSSKVASSTENFESGITTESLATKVPPESDDLRQMRVTGDCPKSVDSADCLALLDSAVGCSIQRILPAAEELLETGEVGDLPMNEGKAPLTDTETTESDLPEKPSEMNARLELEVTENPCGMDDAHTLIGKPSENSKTADSIGSEGLETGETQDSSVTNMTEVEGSTEAAIKETVFETEEIVESLMTEKPSKTDESVKFLMESAETTRNLEVDNTAELALTEECEIEEGVQSVCAGIEEKMQTVGDEKISETEDAVGLVIKKDLYEPDNTHDSLSKGRELFDSDLTIDSAVTENPQEICDTTLIEEEIVKVNEDEKFGTDTDKKAESGLAMTFPSVEAAEVSMLDKLHSDIENAQTVIPDKLPGTEMTEVPSGNVNLDSELHCDSVDTISDQVLQGIDGETNLSQDHDNTEQGELSAQESKGNENSETDFFNSLQDPISSPCEDVNWSKKSLSKEDVCLETNKQMENAVLEETNVDSILGVESQYLKKDEEKLSHSDVKINNKYLGGANDFAKTSEFTESMSSLASLSDVVKEGESTASSNTADECLPPDDFSIQSTPQKLVPDSIGKVISDPEVMYSQACTLIDFDSHLSGYVNAEKQLPPKSTDKPGSSLEMADAVVLSEEKVGGSEQSGDHSHSITENIEDADELSTFDCGELQSSISIENTRELHAVDAGEVSTENSESIQQKNHEQLNKERYEDGRHSVIGMEMIPYKSPSRFLENIVRNYSFHEGEISLLDVSDDAKDETLLNRFDSDKLKSSVISVEDVASCHSIPDEMQVDSKNCSIENWVEFAQCSGDKGSNVKCPSEVKVDAETYRIDVSLSLRQDSAPCSENIPEVPIVNKDSDGVSLALMDSKKENLLQKDQSESLVTTDELIDGCPKDDSAPFSHTEVEHAPQLPYAVEHQIELSITKETVEHLSLDLKGPDVKSSLQTPSDPKNNQPSHDHTQTSVDHSCTSPGQEISTSLGQETKYFATQLNLNKAESLEGEGSKSLEEKSLGSTPQVPCVAESEDESLVVANIESHLVEVCSPVNKSVENETYHFGISNAASAKETLSDKEGENIEKSLDCSKSNSETANVVGKDYSTQIVEPEGKECMPRVGNNQFVSEDINTKINSSVIEASHTLSEPDETHFDSVPGSPNENVLELDNTATENVDLSKDVGESSISPSKAQSSNSDTPTQNVGDESSCMVSDGALSVLPTSHETPSVVPQQSSTFPDVESALSEECASPKQVEGSGKNVFSLDSVIDLKSSSAECVEENSKSDVNDFPELPVTSKDHQTFPEDTNIPKVSVEFSCVQKTVAPLSAGDFCSKDNGDASSKAKDFDSELITEPPKSVSDEMLCSLALIPVERKIEVESAVQRACQRSCFSASNSEKIDQQEITVCFEVPAEISAREIDGTEKKDESKETSSTTNNPPDVNNISQEVSLTPEKDRAAAANVSHGDEGESSLLEVVEVKREVCFSGEDSQNVEDSRVESVSSCTYDVKDGVITILDDKVEDDTTEPPVLELLCPLCREMLAEPLEEHIIKHHICVSFIPAKSTPNYRHHMVLRVSETLDLPPELVSGECAYVCRSCHFSSKDINAVRFHLNIHEDIYQVRTGVGSCSCDQKVYSYQFHRWKSLIHNSIYYCGACSYYFACEIGLINHVIALHYVQSRCKICNEEIPENDFVVHLDHHNSDSKGEEVEVDLPESQMTTRSKGCYGVSWNIYDNFLNYLDGKYFRLNVANKVADENLDRSYLTLPIRNVLDDVTVPDRDKLDPAKDMRKYLQGKKDIKASEGEINEVLKNFSWFVQMHLEKKSGMKKGKSSSSHSKAKKENELFDILGIRTVKLKSSSRKEGGSPDSTKSAKRKSIENKQESPPEEGISDPTSLTRTRSGMQLTKDESDSLMGDFMNSLALERNSEINGEWSREHTYVCCACGAGYLDLADMMDHKWECHPSVWCAHTMFQGQDSVPQSFCLQFQPPTGRPKKSPVTTPLSPVMLAGPSQIIQGTPDPKTEISNDDAKEKSLMKCSRCGVLFAEVELFHSHLVECGGLHQMMVAKKKNKKGFRFKRRKGQGIPSNRYGASSLPSTPLKAKLGDRSSGLNTPLLDKSHSSLIQSSGVKRRLELAIGSINNHELKNRLKAIISGTKGSSSHALGVPGRRTIKMKLRKKAFDSRLLRKTRHSDKVKEDSNKVQKGDESSKVPKSDEKQGTATKDEKGDVDGQPTKKTVQKKGTEAGKDKKLQGGGDKSSQVEGNKNKVKKSGSSSKLAGGKKSGLVNDSVVSSENVSVTTSVAAEVPGEPSVARKKPKGGKKLLAEKKINGLINVSKQKETSDTKQLDSSASDVKTVDVKKVLAKKILAKKSKTISNEISDTVSDKVINIVEADSLIGNKEISVQKRLKQKLSKTVPVKMKEGDKAVPSKSEKAKSKKVKGLQELPIKKESVKSKSAAGKTLKNLDLVTEEKVPKPPKKAKQLVPVVGVKKLDPQTSLPAVEVPSQLIPKKKVKETQVKEKPSGASGGKTKVPAKAATSTVVSPARKSRYISSSSSEEIDEDSEDSEPEVIRNFRSGRGCTGRLGLRNKSRPMLSRYSFRTCLEPTKRETQEELKIKEDVEEPLEKPEASEVDKALSSDKEELSDSLPVSKKRKRKIANYENQDDCAYVPYENSSDSEDEDYQEEFSGSTRRMMMRRRKKPHSTPIVTELEDAKDDVVAADVKQEGETPEFVDESTVPVGAETQPPKKKNQGKDAKRPSFPVKAAKKYQTKKLKFSRKKSRLVQIPKVCNSVEKVPETDSVEASEIVSEEIPSQQPKKPYSKRLKGKASKSNQDENITGQEITEELGERLFTKKKGKSASDSNLSVLVEHCDSRTSGKSKPSRIASIDQSVKLIQVNVKKAPKKKSSAATAKGEVALQPSNQVCAKAENVISKTRTGGGPQKIKERSSSISLGNLSRAEIVDKKGSKAIKKCSSLSNIPQNISKDSVSLVEQFKKRSLPVRSRTLSELSTRSEDGVIPALKETAETVGIQEQNEREVKTKKTPVQKRKALKNRNKVSLSDSLEIQSASSQGLKDLDTSVDMPLVSLPRVSVAVQEKDLTQVKNFKGKAKKVEKVTKKPVPLNPSSNMKQVNVNDTAENIVSHSIRRSRLSRLSSMTPGRDQSQKATEQQVISNERLVQPADVIAEKVQLKKHILNKKSKCAKKRKVIETAANHNESDSALWSQESSSVQSESFSSSDELSGVTKNSKKRKIPVKAVVGTANEDNAGEKEIPSGVFLPTKRSKKRTLEDPTGVGVFIPTKKSKITTGCLAGKKNSKVTKGLANILKEKTSKYKKVVNNHVKKPVKGKLQAGGCKTDSPENRVKNTGSAKDVENDQGFDTMPVLEPMNIASHSGTETGSNDNSSDDSAGGGVSVRVKRRRSSVEKIKDIPTRSTASSQENPSPPLLHAFTDEQGSMNQGLPVVGKETSVPDASLKTSKNPALRKRRTQSSHEIGAKELSATSQSVNTSNSTEKVNKKKGDLPNNTAPKKPSKRKRAASVTGVTKTGPGNVQKTKPEEIPVAKGTDDGLVVAKVKKTSQKKKKTSSSKKDLDDPKCLDCGLRFDSVASLEDHRQDCITIALEMSLMEAEDHLFECQHCHLTFALKGTHRQHTASCRLGKYKRPLQKHDGKGRRRTSGRGANSQGASVSPPFSERALLSTNENLSKNHEDLDKSKVDSELPCASADNYISQDEPESVENVNDFSESKEPDCIRSIAGSSKLDRVQEFSPAKFKGSPKFRRRSRTNGKVDHIDTEEPLSTSIASEDKCVVCGCEIRDEDMSNKHLLLEQFAHSCQQQPVLEVCVLLAYYNLSIEAVRSLAASAIFYQGSTILKLDAKQQTSPDLDPCLSSTENKSASQLLQILATPHCMWVSSVLEAIAKHYYSVEAVSISGTRQEALKAITVLEELFKEIANIDSTIRKNQMLRTMKETFEAGTL
ncbi:uncharacterized protein LOC135209135 [Macrobrachium nipponense]|uniref:uncharacterized protein LOC135209135 n=1 Tax=Macrobrachium nipponense TaxID=159736 RepID=UPI0030C7A3F1